MLQDYFLLKRMSCDTVIALNLSTVEIRLPEPVALFPGTVAGYELILCLVESIPCFLSLDWFGGSLQQGCGCSWSNISAKSLDLGPTELL